MKTALGLLLAAAATCLTYVSANTSCSVRTEVGSCSENLVQYLEMPVNLENVMLIYSPKRAVMIDKRCSMFRNVTSCVDSKLEGCELESDPFLSRWENAQLIMAYICGEHKQAFATLQCPSTEAVRTEVLRCDLTEDMTQEDRRNKRHSCNDYQEEVRCVDGAVTRHCGESDASLVGYITRVFLTGTPNTKDCRATKFDATNVATTKYQGTPLHIVFSLTAVAAAAAAAKRRFM